MVTIEYPALSIAGGTCNPSKEAAFILPTAFSGVQVTYGGESCADNPEPGTIAGTVFIPAQHAAFFPQLADPVSLRATINGEDMRITAGNLDELTVEDVPGDDELPELIPNSRNMASAAGWAGRHGYSWATGTALPVQYRAGGARITATAPVPAAGDYDRKTFIRMPAAPITMGVAYVLTAMVLAPLGVPDLSVEWLDNTGATISTIRPYVNYVGGAYKFEYTGVRSEPLWPAYGTVSARITVESYLDPGRMDWEQEAGVDGVVLHQLPEGATELPQLRPAGRWVRFKASDVLAPAARLIIGTTPWPQQTIEGRTTALNAIVPANYVTFAFGSRDPYQLLAPRDIDRQNALEIYQRVLASSGDLAIAATWPQRAVQPAPLPRFAQVLADVAGKAEVVVDPGVPELPAGAIQAGPLQTDVTNMANQIRLEYRAITDVMEQTAEDASVLYVNAPSVTAFGAMGRSISTDLSDPAGTLAESKAQRLADAQAKPYYRLADKLRLVSSQIPGTPQLAKVYSAETGFSQLVYVAGGPELLGEYHRIRGAVLTFGRLPTVELDVEPAGYAAPEPVSFDDTMGGTAPFDTLTLEDFDNVTLDQLASVSAMEE